LYRNSERLYLTVHACEILTTLKSIGGSDNTDLSDALRQFAEKMDEDLVLKVLQKQQSNWQVALAFFNWAAGLPAYLATPMGRGPILRCWTLSGG